jgi:D-beta-D-heptose 7-phosphate kinase/D-beta-D-heptose 1-phosphate adenosyltransferase
MPMDAQQLRPLVETMVGRRVAVIGDVMLDAYLMGRIGRISPEAPVPVFEVLEEQLMLGGAANVAKCLIALGARARLCGVTGADPDAEALAAECAALGVAAAALVADPSRPTTRKTRVVAQHQQMMRLDREVTSPVAQDVQRQLVVAVEEAIADADAVVLSDYGKGVLSEAVCRAAISAAAQRDVPVIVDPKDLPWDRYRGATLIKPNRREAGWFVGQSVGGDAEVADAASAIGQHLEAAHVLVTRSERGMTLWTGAGASGPRVLHEPPLARDVFDVTGAGDAVAAALAAAMAGGADAVAAMRVANVAGAVKVSKFGAAVVTPPEILEAVGHRAAAHEKKVMSAERAASFAAELRHRGKTVVFTNGCFDILHAGHVHYLEASRQHGDALIVGLNTDASVKRLKGPSRPVQNEADRAHIMASQACVDAVVLFDQDTPIELIRAVRPDVLTKGADYVNKPVVGAQDVAGWGGRVELIDFIEGRSTTKIIDRSRA